jgi:release factor glutamine methyltransferase
MSESAKIPSVHPLVKRCTVNTNKAQIRNQTMLPTPSTSHVSFATIYEPAEDSFLLLDTLSSAPETTWLHSRLRPAPTTLPPTPLIVELGTGSGVVVAFLLANAPYIFGTDILAMGIDVNVNACHAAAQTASTALAAQGSRSVYLGSMCADLAGPLPCGLVDVLVFNPPYVPTAELPELPGRGPATADGDRFAREAHLLSLSYAGGALGMETTERLLGRLPLILSGRGVAYVLLCAQNRPEEVKARIRAWDRSGGRGWCAETVGRSGRTAGWEKLEIVRIWQGEVQRYVLMFYCGDFLHSVRFSFLILTYLPRLSNVDHSG